MCVANKSTSTIGPVGIPGPKAAIAHLCFAQVVERSACQATPQSVRKHPKHRSKRDQSGPRLATSARAAVGRRRPDLCFAHVSARLGTDLSGMARVCSMFRDVQGCATTTTLSLYLLVDRDRSMCLAVSLSLVISFSVSVSLSLYISVYFCICISIHLSTYRCLDLSLSLFIVLSRFILTYSYLCLLAHVYRYLSLSLALALAPALALSLSPSLGSSVSAFLCVIFSLCLIK